MENDEEFLLIKYEKYIKKIVHSFKVSPYDEDDLYQAGLMGFIQAIRHYDKNKNVKLTTFAFKYVYGAIYKEYEKINPYGKKIYNEIRAFIKLNNNLTSDEIISKLKISKETFFIALSESDKITYLEDDVVDNLIDNEKKELNSLTEDEMLIYKYYVLHKLSQSEIAKLMNTSQSTISRKIKNLKKKYKK